VDQPGVDIQTIEVAALALDLTTEVRSHPRFDRPLEVHVRPVSLLHATPWVRSAGKLTCEVQTQGWRFPLPPELRPAESEETERTKQGSEGRRSLGDLTGPTKEKKAGTTRLKPPSDAVLFKDRLLYLLQPPLETIFGGKQVQLPFQPYPYQLQGIAFLMPRHHALLADEMGLGKTIQVIVAMRLMFHAGMIRNALVVCPKPLVTNWARELRLWAEDVPFEVIGGDTEARRACWHVSNCPLKLVNYELLTRDADEVLNEKIHFDLVVLDEAQRIKTRESKTGQVTRGIKRSRSWAMSGTPVENRTEDLVNIFAFVDEKRIPPDTPPRMLPELTSDCILRRTKEEAAPDMPPRIIQDRFIELSAPQREAYDRAEKEGVIHLNSLGETITIQHVFELMWRLKMLCNFDPRTGQSAKLEQLTADLAEVAASGRKAIVFSQYIEPLQRMAEALREYGTLQYHGQIPHRDRQGILDRFRSDPTKHVILMSYGTGSVGLNLQFTNYVFLFDRWWNPAIEDQAINRAHRIGQTEPVFVQRFITPGTIEERVAAVLDKKRQLFAELIEQNGPPPSLGLSENDIFGLFGIKARPRHHGKVA
jgi:SNF2 family DNA or RNA helicase